MLLKLRVEVSQIVLWRFALKVHILIYIFFYTVPTRKESLQLHNVTKGNLDLCKSSNAVLMCVEMPEWCWCLILTLDFLKQESLAVYTILTAGEVDR